MKTFTFIIGIPETWYGISYHRLEVEAETQEQAEKEALQAAQDGAADFIGLKPHDSVLNYEFAEVAEIHEWAFNAGDEVMVEHTGPGVYPPSPATVREKVIVTSKVCSCCGIGREFSPYPSPWQDRPGYVVEYASGGKATVGEERLTRKE